MTEIVQDEIQQSDIDQQNMSFWNELCGTGLAKFLNIVDDSAESLRKFDDYYLNTYPYLLKHVDLAQIKDKAVLEIGLGYGTLGQQLANVSSFYTGLDIAAGPVNMMNHRLKLLQVAGVAKQGSMLNCPLADNSQDVVVSIGCFHHTGNVKKCIDETYRVLKPGGRAVLMVYNKYSYRQWLRWPKPTWQAFLEEYAPILARSRGKAAALEAQRKAYDANSASEAAPETVFCSIRELKKMLNQFTKVSFTKENNDPVTMFGGKLLLKRESLLSTLGRIMGLDIYLNAVK